jgi:hypothetical protein
MKTQRHIDELVDVGVLNQVMEEASNWVIDANPAKWPTLAKEAAANLIEIFGLISERAAVSEELIDFQWETCFYGVTVSARGKRTNAHYDLSLTATHGLTLSSQLCQLTLLHRVMDTFWGHLAALTAIPGNAKFADNVSAFDRKSEAGPSLQSRSSVFCMIRNYVLLALEDPDCITDLGSIEYSPERQTKIDVAIDQLSTAISHIYSMNYEMYRLAYISARGRSKSARDSVR